MDNNKFYNENKRGRGNRYVWEVEQKEKLALFLFLAKEQVLWTMTTKAVYLSLIKHLCNECQMLLDYLLWARC